MAVGLGAMVVVGSGAITAVGPAMTAALLAIMAGVRVTLSRFCARAAQLASNMEAEDGIAEGFAHLLGELPRESLLCDACLLLEPPELCVATFNLCHTRHVVVQLTMMLVGLVLGLLAGPPPDQNPST